MFDKIKRWLFKRKHLIIESTLDKINYISSHKINYRELYTIQSYFAYDNIKKYNHVLKSILEQDLVKDKIEVDDMDSSSKGLMFLYWCNQDGIFDSNLDEHMALFLDLSKEIINYVNYYKAARLKMKYYYYNVRVLETHIIYLDGIIDKIYSIVNLESAG